MLDNCAVQGAGTADAVLAITDAIVCIEFACVSCHTRGCERCPRPHLRQFCRCKRPPSCDSLYGVTATSASSSWAVGTLNGGAEVVILRWNGNTWKNSQSAPAPG